MANLSAGYAVAAADTAGQRFAGIVNKQVDNGSGGAGDLNVVLWRTGEFSLLLTTTPTQADVGKLVYASDDQKVSLAQPGGGNVLVGEIVGLDSGDYVWVDIEPGTRSRQSHIAVLTGSITAATTTTGGDCISLANPFGENVIILGVVIDVTTPATGAANMDVGVAADGTTTADTLLDGTDVGTAAIVADTFDNPGTNGVNGLGWTTTQFITGTPSADATGLVGTYKVIVLLPTAK